MKQLLFLAHRIPFPPDKGDKIRSFHEVAYLAARGWQVHLCALADDPDDLRHVGELKRYCKTVFVEPISPRTQRLLSWRGLHRGLPLSVPYFYAPALQRRVDRLLQRYAMDAVFCFSGPMAEYVFRAPSAERGRAAPPPRLLMDLVDVDSDKWAQYAQQLRWPRSWVYRCEAALLARYEAKVARRFDATLLVSSAEADLFRRRTGQGGDKIHGIANGVDLEFFCPHAPAGADDCVVGGAQQLVFCGAMDYYPNIDAVAWFAREVLPQVQARAGAVDFTVVGARPTAEVLSLGELPGVRVTGRVQDVRPYVRGADLSVAPIRVARGIQNKVLEAMAMAKPVVATPEAFEGIEATAGVELQVCRGEAHSFADAVVDLLADASRRRSMGRAARELVEEKYGWEARLHPLGEWLGDGGAAPTPQS